MTDRLHHLEDLKQASINAEKAFNAAFSSDFAQHPDLDRKTWAAAAILHCDIMRYMVTLENCTPTGLARLLWIGDIVSMLYEAREWYRQTGNANLFKIASSNGFDQMDLRDELRSIKLQFPLGGLDAYETYRNKVGHHYDQDFVDHLHVFTQSDSAPFFSMLTNYAKHANHWAALCKRIIEHGTRA